MMCLVWGQSGMRPGDTVPSIFFGSRRHQKLFRCSTRPTRLSSKHYPSDWFLVSVDARSPEPGWSDTGILAVQADTDIWSLNGLFYLGSCNPHLSHVANQTCALLKSMHPMVQDKSMRPTNHMVYKLWPLPSIPPYTSKLFFGPYTIVATVGVAPDKLGLSAGSLVHPLFSICLFDLCRSSLSRYVHGYA
jgi:hypothetical protein